MKYLIVSDIHGSKESSELLVSLDFSYNFEKILLLGDISYSGARNIPPKDYSPIDVTANLQKLVDKLVIIRGNCDSRVDEFVLKKEFHDLLNMEINGHKFILTHGDLYDENSFELNKGDVFLYGHTHLYRLDKINDHFVINPGSITLPKGGNEKSYIIYDTTRDIMDLYTFEGKLIKSLELK